MTILMVNRKFGGWKEWCNSLRTTSAWLNLNDWKETGDLDHLYVTHTRYDSSPDWDDNVKMVKI